MEFQLHEVKSSSNRNYNLCFRSFCAVSDKICILRSTIQHLLNYFTSNIPIKLITAAISFITNLDFSLKITIASKTVSIDVV